MAPSVLARGMHHCRVNEPVVVDELHGPAAVRHDTADGARGEIHHFGPVGLKPVVDGRLIAQMELLARDGEGLLSGGLETPYDGRSDRTAMAGDENAGTTHAQRW